MRPASVPRIGKVEKVLVPLQVFEFASKVVEAIVMSAEPLKETPLISRAFWSVVAVPALPPILRVLVETKDGVPAEPVAFARIVFAPAVFAYEVVLPELVTTPERLALVTTVRLESVPEMFPPTGIVVVLIHAGMPPDHASILPPVP